MADFSKVTVNGTTYNVKDATARTAASAAQTTANSKLSDAPSDGKQYARKDGVWSEVEATGSGVPDGGTIGQVLAKRSDTDGDAGWYNLRHLPSDKWYLPDGIVESDVIAAYQFVDRLNEAEALININEGTEYALTKVRSNIYWNDVTGFEIGPFENCGLTNDTLRQTLSTNMYGAAFGFSDASMTSTSHRIIGGLKIAVNRYLAIRGWESSIGIARDSFDLPAINWGASATVYNTQARLGSNGVFGGNWSSTSELFYNGISQSLGKRPNDPVSGSITNTPLIIGQPDVSQDSNHVVLKFCVSAMVFYNKILTAAQHLQLSNNIHALGGID